MSQTTIKIITTGGTIDGLDYSKEEDKPKKHQTLLPKALRDARVAVRINVCDLMSKDSRFVTDEDREEILKVCRESKEDKIVISHGTMSLPATAKYLGKEEISKTIILFGAARSLSEGVDSFFNLGSAVTAAQLLPYGVYVTMNGKLFDWNNVKKDFSTGFFENER